MACIWDAANKSASITLYRAATCAASTASNGTWKGVRATTSQTTGKLYLEVTQGYIANSGQITGFGNASFNTANYVGSDGNSFGYQSTNGATLGITGGWQGTTKMGEVIQIAIDLDAKLVWARTDRSTNWNNSGTANPATGTGGRSYTTTGALFPAVSLLGSNATNMNWAVLNTGAFTFTGSIPSGFSAWDTGAPAGTGIGGTFGPTTWNASTKNANITLTGPNLQASQQTAANTWGTVYSTSNYDSGQVYFELTILSYDNNGGLIFGVSDGTAGTANGMYVGNSLFAVGCQILAGGPIYWQSASNTGEPTWQNAQPPNVVGCAVDLNRGLMWVKNLNADPGLWNNDAAGDPVAGTRGIAIPPGDLYIGFSGFFNSAADTVVLNVGASVFTGTAPSGYSAWDATGATGATAQLDVFAREVLLADTGVVQVDAVTREVLLTETSSLQVDNVMTEALMTNPSSLQVAGVFGEVLRSTTIWTPLPSRKSRTYVIR